MRILIHATGKLTSLNNIEHDLMELQRAFDQTPVAFSFVGDPYNVAKTDNVYVREVLRAFRDYNHPFKILSKGGMLAAKYFNLYGLNDWFGVS